MELILPMTNANLGSYFSVDCVKLLSLVKLHTACPSSLDPYYGMIQSDVCLKVYLYGWFILWHPPTKNLAKTKAAPQKIANFRKQTPGTTQNMTF